MPQFREPRKGTTHTRPDVADELGDIAFTTLVTAAGLGYDQCDVLARTAAKVRSLRTVRCDDGG